jgi:hypothetical protein
MRLDPGDARYGRCQGAVCQGDGFCASLCPLSSRLSALLGKRRNGRVGGDGGADGHTDGQPLLGGRPWRGEEAAWQPTRELGGGRCAADHDRREQQPERTEERDMLHPAGVGWAAAFHAYRLHRGSLSRFVTRMQYP